MKNRFFVLIAAIVSLLAAAVVVVVVVGVGCHASDEGKAGAPGNFAYPVGPAGGVLDGSTYPNPTIGSGQLPLSALGQGGASNGQGLVWGGDAWAPGTSLPQDAAVGAVLQNTDAGWLGTSGAISVSYTASVPSSLNLSTEGTLDWFAPVTQEEIYRANNGYPAPHWKLMGGDIMRSWEHVQQGYGNWAQTADGLSMSSTASDDTLNAALSTSYSVNNYTSDNTHTGWGYKFAAPADMATHVLKIYAHVFNGQATYTFHVSDGSFADSVNTTTNCGSACDNHFTWTVTYHAAHDGQKLYVSALMTTVNTGSGGNWRLGCITLH